MESSLDVRVDPARLGRTLQAVIGERSPALGPCRLVAVESLIERELRACGIAITSDYFSFSGTSFRNIIGEQPASEDAPLLVLGAHLDAVPGSPGADGDASGVAVLLEAARTLARLKPCVRLLYCAFNLEEANMVGSRHLVRRLSAADAAVDGMIALEMVGYTAMGRGSQRYPPGLRAFYPDRGDFLGLIANWHSRPLLHHFAATMRQVEGLPIETLVVPRNGALLPPVRLGDHAPFWDAGYRALMITDTAFFRNPHYHRPSDTLETLDLPFMARVCEGVIRAAVRYPGARRAGR